MLHAKNAPLTTLSGACNLLTPVVLCTVNLETAGAPLPGTSDGATAIGTKKNSSASKSTGEASSALATGRGPVDIRLESKSVACTGHKEPGGSSSFLVIHDLNHLSPVLIPAVLSTSLAC